MKSVANFIMIYMIYTSIGISAAISPQDIKAWSEMGMAGWEIFNKIFFPSTDAPTEPLKKPAAILMQYKFITSKRKSKSRSKYINFDSKIANAANIKEGPYETLENTAQKLTKKKKSALDVSEECELIYYEYTKDGEQNPINMFDDSDVLILMAKDGDQPGNTRLIDVVCEHDTNELHSQSLAIQEALYDKNEKAFNHVIAIQNDNTDIQTQSASSALNEAGFGGFAIDAKGLAILDIEKNSFKPRTDALAKEWEWNGQIKSLLGIVTDSGKQFSGGLNVEFDPANWKIKGSYTRFAGFKTVEEKYSIYVATAKFEYIIPRAEREGNTLDHLGITSGGSIKGEYFERIKVLMEGKALERFNIDVVKPSPDDYKIHGNEKQDL